MTRAKEPSPAAEGTCLRLRTKTMYTPVSRPEPDPQRSWRTAPYWCQRTMRPVGPDGDPVDPRACVRERACFEGSGPRSE
ncbi:MAG TPA: hypothetical protein VFI25_10850 [Planctomycetota bacterium]|nr:hypothetical protein [Planctomycetota bacterium]